MVFMIYGHVSTLLTNGSSYVLGLHVPRESIPPKDQKINIQKVLGVGENAAFIYRRVSMKIATL